MSDQADQLVAQATQVDTGKLLVDVESTIRRFVIMSDDALTTASLWVLHVYAFQAAEFTPYLAVTSATKRSGKSRLLEVFELLLGSDRAVSTASISPAVLFRLIDGNPGVAVLIDEVDRNGRDNADELWGLVNSGWRFGGRAHRMSGQRMNKVSTFSTFAPKVL